MTYNIMARMSGGVQGTREALYKTAGQLVMFDSRAEATVFADSKTQDMNERYSTVGNRDMCKSEQGGLQTVFEYNVVEAVHFGTKGN